MIPFREAGAQSITGPVKKEYNLGDGRTLVITLSEEGIIADVLQGGFTFTYGQLASDFADFVAQDGVTSDE